MRTQASPSRRPAAPAVDASPTGVPVEHENDVVATIEPRITHAASNSQLQPSTGAWSITSDPHSATQTLSTMTPGDPAGCPGGGSGAPTVQAWLIIAV